MPSAIRFRSARCLSAYWDHGDLRIVNYLTRKTFSANPVVLEVIGFFFPPRTIADAMREFDSYTGDSVGATLLNLIKSRLLLECGSRQAARDELLDSSWRSWLPEGGFHFLTKDAPYVGGEWTAEEKMRSLPSTPQPPLFKNKGDTASISLPLPRKRTDSFFKTLYARRTGRKFSSRPVALDSIATLLRTTWGVQGYVQSEYLGPLPLKTSPSGGARHPIEVYLMALNVTGFDPGLYHYDARGHALERIAAATPQRARKYCADQPYVAAAAALFIMTGVFARSMWKYHHPRAYRVVLLEAGHFGQTFCLTATRMGLAAFSTAAMKDSLVERDLRIDGISESVLYITGVGAPPRR